MRGRIGEEEDVRGRRGEGEKRREMYEVGKEEGCGNRGERKSQ